LLAASASAKSEELPVAQAAVKEMQQQQAFKLLNLYAAKAAVKEMQQQQLKEMLALYALSLTKPLCC
jgi:hypothetical protein